MNRSFDGFLGVYPNCTIAGRGVAMVEIGAVTPAIALSHGQAWPAAALDANAGIPTTVRTGGRWRPYALGNLLP